MSAAGGCGGGCGSGGGSGCGCGGSGPAGVDAARDGAFARPEFFAGQLLTDKDLDDLTAYVRGKNRLHNRYLHGAGVVCGLDVTMVPGHESVVAITAGYALDCCGDDIVVPCDLTLDVVDLLADLPPGHRPLGTKDEPERRYELRVEYAETAADLVAPYTSDDDIAVACAPTRIREGYRFSVCPVPDSVPRQPTLLERLLTDSPDDAARDDLIERVRAAHDVAAGLATDAPPAGAPPAEPPAGAPPAAPPAGTPVAVPRAEQLQAVRAVLAEARDWLLRHLAAPGPDLVRMVLDADDAAALRDAARTVLAALRRVASEEVCAAINPPGPPCDDLAVPLAVVTVAGCKVTDVCTFVRRHVLSGPAVRHWLPIDALYEEVEKICCGTGEGGELIRALREISGGPGADADPQKRLIRMLNSQVQKFEARLRKLEKGNGNA